MSWLPTGALRRVTSTPVTAVVLNSPFLDVPAAWAVRALAPRPLAVLAKNRPLMVLPSAGPSFYQVSTHRSERGEWDFVPEWKPVTGGVVRVEWLAAAQRAIARAHAGLGLECPILVLCSARSVRARQWTDEFFRGDAVLDPDAIARWSTRLGTACHLYPDRWTACTICCCRLRRMSGGGSRRDRPVVGRLRR